MIRDLPDGSVRETRRSYRAVGATRLLHARARHANNVQILALELRLLFQHHQRALIAGLDHDSRPAKRFDLLALEIHRQVRRAAIVPNQPIGILGPRQQQRTALAVADHHLHRALCQQLPGFGAQLVFGRKSLEVEGLRLRLRDVFRWRRSIQFGVWSELARFFRDVGYDLLEFLALRGGDPGEVDALEVEPEQVEQFTEQNPSPPGVVVAGGVVAIAGMAS